jgi:hypothetical protein
VSGFRALAGVVVTVLLLGGVSGAPEPSRSLAVLTDGTAVTGSFTASSWPFHLHNEPTPPTGNTAAVAVLGMDHVAPTATTLHAYATNCNATVGRQITRGTGLVGESNVCRHITWRSSALAADRGLDGMATVRIWARKSANGGQSPTLRVFLRDRDPVGGGTYTELGSADVTVTTNLNQPHDMYEIAIPVSAIVPAGHLFELKLVATGGNRSVRVAYDTTTYESTLTFP